MPNLPSAAKRMRSDAKKRITNQGALSELKTISKRLYAMSSQEPQKAAAYARGVISKYDHAASNGIIPRERADRKKARIAGLLQKVLKKK